jgi:mono/diheme cytochrome c family protein
MDQMHRYDAQESSPFYADGRAMRPRVEGTIPFGQAKTDDRLHRGQVNGEWVATIPIELDDDVLARGQQRFNIYCSPCHDESGSGDGIIVQRGMIPPPSFHDDRMSQAPVGELYNAITFGIRNMPSYASQVNTNDRWAIVAYIRALQLSQNAPLEAIPADVAAAKGWGANQ